MSTAGASSPKTGHGSPRLAAFDGLRACAALSVLAYHVGLACALSRSGTLAPLFSELKAGVTVFFVISGCLLYLPYARALRARQTLPDWRAYARRRVLRILPGYWVALTLLALGPLAGSVITPNWWRYYGLTQIYDANTVFGGLGVAWSLCVEVSFYALLPLFALGLARLVRTATSTRTVRIQLAVLAVLACSTWAIRLGVTGGSVNAPVPHSGFVLATTLLGFLDWFALGMGLAVLASAWEHGELVLPRVRRLAARPECCWVLGVACFAAAAATQGGDQFLPLCGLTSHVAAGVASALLLLPAVAPARSRAAGPLLTALSHPVSAWLGTVSYGIYLWHVPVLQAIRGPLTNIPNHPAGIATYVGLLALVVAGAVALGAASWYLVERPARRLFARAREPQPAVARA